MGALAGPRLLTATRVMCLRSMDMKRDSNGCESERLDEAMSNYWE